MSNQKFGGGEILHVAEAVSRDRGIPKMQILKILEEAVAMSAKKKYGQSINLKASINHKTGEIELYRELCIGKPSNEEDNQEFFISFEEAKKNYPNAQEGDKIKEPLPPIEMGRLIALSAKQIIATKMKELEREKLHKEFNNKVGEIVTGIVEKIEGRAFIVKIGTVEAILKKDQALPTDYYKLGDRVKAYLLKLDKDAKGPMLILSRTNKEFVKKLFTQEVPEIYDKTLEIKGIAREPGSKTKLAVYSSDPSIDPVGSCVGIRGARVQAVINELRGEKIDILKWSEDLATYIVNSLGSIKVSKVIIDEDENKVEVVVDDESQSKAIGRRGQNIRLISELVGSTIDVTTESSESEKRQGETAKAVSNFVTFLDFEEILAQLLVTEGFKNIESLASADIEAIAKIDGLDKETALEIISRAKEYLENCNNIHNENPKE